MGHKIVDLSEHQEAKAREHQALRVHVENQLECSAILASAIDEMWTFADREEILKTLRLAIDVLDNPDVLRR